jgi:hypothetical protein
LLAHNSTDPTIRDNYQLIREKLHDYVLAHHVEYGNVDEWNRRANRIQRDGELVNVNLWIDSVDFPLSGTRSINRKSLYWSYKLNGKGQRFMAIVDAAGRIRFLSPAYLPKLYDGDFLQMNRYLFENSFKGGAC